MSKPIRFVPLYVHSAKGQVFFFACCSLLCLLSFDMLTNVWEHWSHLGLCPLAAEEFFDDVMLSGRSCR
jgi:hypothetical protein